MEGEMSSMILKKLEEYGDLYVHGKPKTKLKTEERQKTEPVDDKRVNPGQTCPKEAGSSSQTGLSARQKKKLKRKKKTKTEPSGGKTLQSNVDTMLSGHERKLKEWSDQLGLSELKQQEARKSEDIKKEKKGPEVVVFTSHKSKKAKPRPQDVQESSTVTSGGPEFDMKQARFEVQKFGIKGFQGNQKQEAMNALLMKLGAKPARRKYVNYKEYQENRKQQMQEEKEKRETDKKLGYKVPKARQDRKRTKDRNDIGHLDGQVGIWKRGVQVISKDDLKGFKKSKLKS